MEWLFFKSINLKEYENEENFLSSTYVTCSLRL